LLHFLEVEAPPETYEMLRSPAESRPPVDLAVSLQILLWLRNYGKNAINPKVA